MKPKIAIFAGLVLTVTGFILITLAWSGAASQDVIQGQFPYLSAGLAGLGLVMTGLAFVVIQLIKVEGDRRARQWEQLINTVGDLAARLAAESAEDIASRTDEYWAQPRSADEQATSVIPTWRPSS
jgi:membrane-bound ClpP family serine protease